MAHKAGHDGSTPPGVPPRCPVCGAVLEVKLLELEDEARDEPETMLLLDCPQGHVHATLTQEDVVTMMTAEVRGRLRLMP